MSVPDAIRLKRPFKKLASPARPTLPISACFQPGGNDGAIRGQGINPFGDDGNRLLVHHVFGQRRHLQVADDADAMEQNGFGSVAGHDNFRAGNAERIGDRSVEDVLFFQRRVKARVEKRLDAAGPMALRAIGVEIGTGAESERRGWCR